MKTRALTESPYAPLLESFLIRSFPSDMTGHPALVDAITSAFISTGQTRLGPAPAPEGMVAIRDRIRYWTERNEPIAVMSPWGSKKAINRHTVDIAELMAIKTLLSLDERVRRHYPPGIQVHMRIEDLGGNYLWQNEPEAQVWSRVYVQDLRNLVKILDQNKVILARTESEMVSEKDFVAAAERVQPVILDHLNEPTPETTAELKAVGWRGNIPTEQVDFYMAQYTKFYPNDLNYHRKVRLSLYFAQSLARYRVGAHALPEWGDNYIYVGFPPPVPGTPRQLTDNRLFYRTIPMKYARTHMPPWRAKGVLQVDNGNDVVPKLRSWFDTEDEIYPMSIELLSEDEQTRVTLETDYICR